MFNYVGMYVCCILYTISFGFCSSNNCIHEQFASTLNACAVYPIRSSQLTQSIVARESGSKDNLAIVNVNGYTTVLRSGIIDRTFFQYLSSKYNIGNFCSEYVTTLDLLYIDDTKRTDFSDMISDSRKKQNRVIFTRLMHQIMDVWIPLRDKFQANSNTSQLNSRYNSKNKYWNRIDLEYLCKYSKLYNNKRLSSFINAVNAQMSNRVDCNIVQTVIGDFLIRLRKYVGTVACVNGADKIKSSVMQTEHNTDNKSMLVKEIDKLLDETSKLLEGGISVGDITVGCLRLIRGIHIEMGNILGIYNRLQNRRTILDARYEYKYDGCFSIVPPDKYLSDITHTEQMIDYLERAFGFKIRFIISGKAPCLKCSQYIQYAVYTDEINNTANTNNTQNNANNEDNNAVDANVSNNTDNSNTTSSVSGNVDSTQNSAENDTNQLSNVSDTATPANNTDTSNNAASNADGSVPISENSTITNSANNSTNTNNLIRIIDLWNERCAVCFKTSFDYGNTNQHMYPIKVFNANDGNGYKVTKTLRINLDDNGSIKNNTYDTGDFGNMLGINKSNIYAIDNISDYSGQLTMNDDGTVVECMENDAKYQRSTDEPVLLSVTSKDITLDECESDNVQLSGIQKWRQEQREGHKAIRQWIEQNNNTVLQKLKNIFKI